MFLVAIPPISKNQDHHPVTLDDLLFTVEMALRKASYLCLRKCAAGAAAQAPLGPNALCTMTFIARRIQRPASAMGTPPGDPCFSPYLLLAPKAP